MDLERELLATTMCSLHATNSILHHKSSNYDKRLERDRHNYASLIADLLGSKIVVQVLSDFV